MLDLIREISQTLKNNKLRTSLTGFAVAWGIFMLIVLLGMGRGVFNSFNESSGAQGANSIEIWGGMTSMPYAGFKEGRQIKLEDKDMYALESRNRQHIENATAAINASDTIISTPDDYISGSYTGVYPVFFRTRGITVYKGRFINDNDMEHRRKVMVLAKKNAEILFPDTTKIIGGRVNCKGLSFTVIGIYESDWRQDTYIPYTTARLLDGNPKTIDQMTVDAKDLQSMEDGEELEQNIRSTLSRQHNFNADDQSALWIWNKFTQHLTMSTGLGILDMAIWIIGIFTMLSGIIGVSNIMFVSVRERVHEIGIRRAIGAKPRNILTQIILESVSITALFGYIGIFMGICVTEILANAFAGSDFIKNPTVDISIAIQVTVVLIIAGALAGIFPALKALKVKPVEALRTE